MERLIVSAPFGNYVKPAGATPTLGTFTLARRPGRVWQILKTVRYYRRLGGWVNRIGLRNPGIEWLESRAGRGAVDVSGSIVSVHGFDDGEWRSLIERAAGLGPLAIELNMSCPNVGEITYPHRLFGDAVRIGGGHGVEAIVKLPPVRYSEMAKLALEQGVRVFHCCNTLPVARGGLSGKPLKPVAQECVRDLLRWAAAWGLEVRVIGGGGITGVGDIDEYAGLGVAHVAIGSKVMHPKHLWSDAGVRPLIDHADRVLADR